MKGVHSTLTLSNISLSGLLFLESTSTTKPIEWRSPES